MHRIGFQFDRVNAIGGGCKSAIWPQIISDITGLELHIVEHPLEAGSMAAALTVAIGMGIYKSADDMDDLIGIGKIVRPIEAHRKRYDDLYKTYRNLYDALQPIYRQLYEME